MTTKAKGSTQVKKVANPQSIKLKHNTAYVVQRTHKGFGGGLFQISIQAITRRYVKYNDTWHTLASFKSTFEILEEIPKEMS